MALKALVVGSTGIVGQNLSNRLVAEGWTVYGLARHPFDKINGVVPLAADLFDQKALGHVLADISVSHVFFSTWSRRSTEKENCIANSQMIENVFQALPYPEKIEHSALVTGMKHYLGSFEHYAQGGAIETPFRESMPRLDVENFYYNQEDALLKASKQYGFSWSVHRPHSIIGYALGNVMNMGTTLAVYASICRETGRPFVFPGSPTQWHSLSDVTDARQLARHLLWAATNDAGRNQAFNVVNGDIFRWKWLWPKLAEWFGIEAAPYPEKITSLADTLSGDADLWQDIVKRYQLKNIGFEKLNSAWHTDADLGRPLETVTDMSKSRLAGFTGYQYTPHAFFDVFERLRAEHIIP